MRSKFANNIEAFELVSQRVFGFVERHIPDSRLPFDVDYPWYVLLEIATGGEADLLERALLEAADNDLILDAIIAKNSIEADKFWRLRHSIAEAERQEGHSLKHDISVPISRMEEFLHRGDDLIAGLVPGAQLVAFGHIGDGNLHYNVLLPEGSEQGPEVTAAIYALVAEFGGSFSAEHGVGRLKRRYLVENRHAAEIDLMRTLKKALDPHNILNPGKVI
jgi:FAD/FMN-containing dehydrogenase